VPKILGGNETMRISISLSAKTFSNPCSSIADRSLLIDPEKKILTLRPFNLVDLSNPLEVRGKGRGV